MSKVYSKIRLFSQTILRASACLAFAIFICFTAAPSAQAQTMTVTRSDDRNNLTCAAGDCSLREAITAANASPDVNTIQFSALFNSPQTITLSNGQLAISTSLTITGKGANLTTVSGNNASRVIFIAPGVFDVTISGLTIANGNSGGNGGGGMRNESTGTVDLINCAFTNNTTTLTFISGGGLEYRPPSNGGILNITGCTFFGNTAGEGGAIHLQNSTTNITNTTISGNTAASPRGGGISNFQSNLTITSSTVTGNTSNGTGNTSGSGGGVNATDSAGITTVRNSIIAGNTGVHPDVSKTFISGGYNFIGKSDGSTGFTDGVNNDQVGTIVSPKNPLLLALSNNGGTTQTHALAVGSPAIDKGSGTGTDQRGFTRPVDLAAYTNAPGGNGADIGAFEAQTAPVATSDLTVTKTHTGNFTQGDTGKTYSITVTNSGGTASSGSVSVSDALPGGLGATDINGTGWNCNFSNLTCTRNDALAANSSYPAITLTVNVASNAPSSVTNFASVLGGGETNTGNNQAADPTTINAAPRYSISGTVKYGTTNVGQPDSFVSGVNLNATGTASASTISDSSGVYQFTNLLGGNYTVTPTKAGEVKGINSLDATRIQQHLIGMTTLTANQLIAADTDGSGTVNSLDATRIQQRAVGMQTPNIIGQWKFVPASRQYNALGGNQTGQDYQAILVGEVSGNWATAASLAANFQTEENEILPETDDQNQTAERFTNNLSGRIAENTKQSSDSSAKESTIELLAPAADIQVSLPANAMASNGATVTIPITVSQIPAGQSIESFDFSVFYNAAVLQPAATPGSSTGTLSASCSVLPFSPVSGRVIVSGSCVPAITTGSGVLYNLTFNVIGSVNQTTSLSFTDPVSNVNTFQFNNGTPTVATANGLFTVLAPTAASVSVSGRVLTGEGRGLMNATVVLTGSDGNTRIAHTGTSGYFRFDNVEAGQTYIFNVSSKRYTFAPQVITVLEDITELNFTGGATGKVFEQIPK